MNTSKPKRKNRAWDPDLVYGGLLIFRNRLSQIRSVDYDWDEFASVLG